MISEDLQNKCNLFADNYQSIKINFKWENAMMLRLGALFYTNKGLVVNPDAIKDAKDIIKKNTGLFSSFKETAFFALSTLLSLEPNAEILFQKVIKVYEDLKEAGFHSSVYLTLAAFSIAKQTVESDTPSIIHRAKAFYDAMKKEHRFLTSADDYGYAAMLATTNLSVDQAITEMENCYSILMKDFATGNALQSLTHVLTIGEEFAATKCQRAIEIYESLAYKGCKLSKYNELAILGTLVLITQDVEKITEEIQDVYEVLKDKKGLGSWSLSKQERTVYGAALVIGEHIESMKENTLNMTLANSITNILIAQQTTMMIAASSAAAASAANA